MNRRSSYRLSYARLVYATAVVAMLLAGCASSAPPNSALSASHKALLSVADAQEYATETGQSAGRLHRATLLTDSELAEVVAAGNELDTAWRSAALAIAQGDPKPVVDDRLALMEAAKLRLEVVWGKYVDRKRKEQ